jgi:hypothetical protein
MIALEEIWNSKTMSDIITGLYTSGIFLLALSFLKPRIKICDKISLEITRQTGTPATSTARNYRYYFKLVNKSILFKIYDVQVRVWSTETRPSVNSDDTYYKEINMIKNYQWVIHRLYFGHILQKLFIGTKRLQSRTNYAAQFSTNDNLEQMINLGRSITIEIIARHSLTGFTRVISKTYKHIGDIERGSFYSGNSCEIK